MNVSYLSKYTVVQIFKSNEFQKVYIATDNNTNQAVVINHIFAGEGGQTLRFIENLYENPLNNVLHFEPVEDGVILVTKVEEGLSLHDYLEETSPSFSKRVHLIHQYLEGIQKYDFLPNHIKSILTDQSQIILSGDRLYFDELIIFNEATFHTVDFQPTMNNIISILKDLTKLQNINYDELPLFINIIGFLDEIQKNKHTYTNIHQLFGDFEKIDVGDSYRIDDTENILHAQQGVLSAQQGLSNLESTSLVGKKVSAINEDAIRMADKSSKRNFTVAIGTAGAITVAVAGILMFKSIFPMENNISANQKTPINEIANVQNVADEEQEKNPSEEIGAADLDGDAVGPNKNITYLSEHIQKNYEPTKYGDFSLVISGDDEGPHIVSIHEKSIYKEGSQFILWVKADSNDEFKVMVKGYANNVLTFNETVTHKPLFTNGWELIQFPFDADVDGDLEVVFDDVTGTLWIGKIAIDTLK